MRLYYTHIHQLHILSHLGPGQFVAVCKPVDTEYCARIGIETLTVEEAFHLFTAVADGHTVWSGQTFCSTFINSDVLQNSEVGNGYVSIFDNDSVFLFVIMRRSLNIIHGVDRLNRWWNKQLSRLQRPVITNDATGGGRTQNHHKQKIVANIQWIHLICEEIRDLSCLPFTSLKSRNEKYLVSNMDVLIVHPWWVPFEHTSVRLQDNSV